MTKLTSLEGKKKKASPCPYCGREPACPDWTCPRLKAVITEDSYQQVEFVTEADLERQGPRELHIHIQGGGTEVLQTLMGLADGPTKDD